MQGKLIHTEDGLQVEGVRLVAEDAWEQAFLNTLVAGKAKVREALFMEQGWVSEVHPAILMIDRT